MEQEQVTIQEKQPQQQGFFSNLASGISNVYDTMKQGVQTAYDRGKTIGQGSMQIAGGIGDAIGSATRVGGGLSKIYKGVTGKQVSDSAKYGIAGLGGIAALNMVPGMGVLTSGLTSLASGAVKGVTKGIGGTIKGAIGAGKALKSLSQTTHQFGKSGSKALKGVKKATQNIFRGATQYYDKGKQYYQKGQEYYDQALKKGRNINNKRLQMIAQQDQNEKKQPIFEIVEQEQQKDTPFRVKRIKGISKGKDRKVIFRSKYSQPDDLKKLALMS